MASVNDRLRHLNIVVRSPDRSVRATVTHRRGITVDLDEHVADQHDDDSLAAQVEAALIGAAQGFGRAAAMIRREAHGGRPDPDGPFERRRRELERRMERVEVSVDSPMGHAVVGWRGAATIVVAIRAGSVRKLRVGQLRTEINAAVMAASILRRRQGMDAYRAVYGFDRFGRRQEHS